jgi:6-pyruvoyltetrahydropterin/6-carboxytetrahydropterin synthase
LATICKLFRFEAAHQLPNHDGKCAQLHGHSYLIEVRAGGDVTPANGAPQEGMVLDFARLKAAWVPMHQRLDHRFLNDLLDFPTTAENLAGYFLTELRATVPEVFSVKVWETATSWAEATA